MFGYLTADISALSREQYQRYKACYCGLCRSLSQRHGQLSRLTLNYDVTFLILLLSVVSMSVLSAKQEERETPMKPDKSHRGLVDMSQVFVPRGQWLTGLSASFSTHDNDMYNVVIINDVDPYLSQINESSPAVLLMYSLAPSAASGLTSDFNTIYRGGSSRYYNGTPVSFESDGSLENVSSTYESKEIKLYRF